MLNGMDVEPVASGVRRGAYYDLPAATSVFSIGPITGQVDDAPSPL